MDLSGIPFFILGTFSVAVIFLLINVIEKLKEGDEKAMASFQLNPEKTVHEFEILFAGSVVMLSGFVAFFGAGLTGSEILLNIGRAGAAFYLLSGIYVLARWRSRF